MKYHIASWKNEMTELIQLCNKIMDSETPIIDISYPEIDNIKRFAFILTIIILLLF